MKTNSYLALLFHSSVLGPGGENQPVQRLLELRERLLNLMLGCVAVAQTAFVALYFTGDPAPESFFAVLAASAPDEAHFVRLALAFVTCIAAVLAGQAFIALRQVVGCLPPED
ncbi:hypothetical protein [Ramlibacter alkalitolerans]|uniref:Uncharacterized protein n=1 Tax=Ramlibacter alkalitolerans TaxID=2039631 RepID=A0ABS1JTU5_9BURK|nr:hypothetical protein [Ramlibacter alkalitolerans]MBL0427674.1 hypothetical protein [Ramlibacter alkalitolerans]